MANLTSDRDTIRKDGSLFSYPVVSGVTIYAGALVNLDSEGYAVPAADDATHRFAGVAWPVGGSGRVCGCCRDAFEFNARNMTYTDTGADVYIVDDNTVGLGIVAQPANVTGVTLARIVTSRGGEYKLNYTRIDDTNRYLTYGAGNLKTIISDGAFTLTAADGSQIMAMVTVESLPPADASDTVKLRHVRCGKIVEVSNPGSVFVDVGA